MFPPSLHKNILALDKQITLLECECDSIDAEKRKRQGNAKLASRVKDPVNYLKSVSTAFGGERPYVAGGRLASAAFCRKGLKTTSSSHHSAKEAPIKGPKDGGGKETTTTTTATTNNSDRVARRYYRKCPVCGSGYDRSAPMGEGKSPADCVCGRNLLGDLARVPDHYGPDAKESECEKKVLHKGILHAHPGGTIELTVTQKGGKHGSSPPVPDRKCSRDAAAAAVAERCDSGSCIMKDTASVASSKVPVKKSSRTQKWSEILSHESDSLLDKRVTPRNVKDHSIKSSYSLGSKLISQLQLDTRRNSSGGDSERIEGDNMERTRGDGFWNEDGNRTVVSAGSCPRKRLQRSPMRKRAVENAVDASPPGGGSGRSRPREFEEKEVQCFMWGDDRARSDASDESCDPTHTLCALMDSFKGKHGSEDTKRLLVELETALEKIGEEDAEAREVADGDCERLPVKDAGPAKKLRKLFWGAKKLCDKLMREKEQLAEDLEAKDRVIASMKNNEMEYMTLISSLKANLEKKKMQVDESADVIKEITAIKDRLELETKVADGLKKSHSKLQEEYHNCLLENDKLKTQIRLNKLEAQKFHVLMAGKDAEIRRYREEVESFQKQITEQLMSLRSNNIANEVHRAMEAILHNSLVFSQTEGESVVSESRSELKLRRIHRDRLVHSSPTSSKSSAADSSWHHISSIRDDDDELERKAAACGADDSDAEIFLGYHEAASSKHSVVHETKKDPSFVSCKSVESGVPAEEHQEEEEEEEVAAQQQQQQDLVATGCQELKKPEDRVATFAANAKLRQNIEELFQEIKMQCSRRIFPPSDSFKLDDLLNSSETSDFSELSASVVELDRCFVKP